MEPYDEIHDFQEWSDYWTVIGENRSLVAEMVSESGRISVMVFGAILIAWSLCLHAVLIWILAAKRSPKHRKQHGDGEETQHSAITWLVVSSSVGQIGLAVLVIPIELVTEHGGGWSLGTGFCRTWRLIHLGLAAMYVWGHFVMTVERYVRCVQGGTGKGRRTPRYITATVVLSSWVVSFLCGVAVTVVMKYFDALADDVCAFNMSVKMAFVLSFTVYFAPAALTLVAVAALFFVRCRRPSIVTMDTVAVETGSQHPASSTSSTTTLTGGPERGYTPERGLAAETMLLAKEYDVIAERDLKASMTVTMAASLVAVGCWAPFYVTNLIVPFCGGLCVDPTLWTLFLWLGYSGIGLSPILWFLEPSVRAKARSIIG